MTEKQFEIIFKAHFTYLSNVAFGLLKDEEDAYDIVQQVFVKLWDKRMDVDIEDNIKAYLHRATINTSFNFIEKQKRNVKVDDSVIANYEGGNADGEKATDFFTGEVEDAIKDAIAKLPEKCGIVFSLSRYSEMSNKEIAEHLDISIKAVEKHISRALRELRETLKPYLPELIIFFLFEVGVKWF